MNGVTAFELLAHSRRKLARFGTQQVPREENAVSEDIAQIVEYTIYHSPNSYLGTLLAEHQLAELQIKIIRTPIFIPRERGVYVADLVGGHEGAVHSSYHREDCARWAARYGMTLHFQPREWFLSRLDHWKSMPFNREELPARAYYAAVGSGKEAALDRALFEAAWTRKLDVNNEETVRDCAARAGLDPETLFERLRSDVVAERAREALWQFDRDKCPGVPTWVFRGQRFWGKDRVEFLRYVAEQTRAESGGSP